MINYNIYKKIGKKYIKIKLETVDDIECNVKIQPYIKPLFSCKLDNCKICKHKHCMDF